PYLTGGGSVQLLSDGTTANIGIAQPFSTPTTTVVSGTGAGTGGSPALLVSAAANNVQYCASIFYKLSNSSPTTGVLTMAVKNASGTIQQDDSGTNLSTTVNLHNIADTNWHQLSLTFRLPKVLPSTLEIRFFLSTILDNTKSVYLSNFALGVMYQEYQGGPYVIGFSGSTGVNASSIQPDMWTFSVTNTLGKMQTGIWRNLDPANVPAAQGADSPL